MSVARAIHIHGECLSAPGTSTIVRYAASPKAYRLEGRADGGGLPTPRDDHVAMSESLRLPQLLSCLVQGWSLAPTPAPFHSLLTDNVLCFHHR